MFDFLKLSKIYRKFILFVAINQMIFMFIIFILSFSQKLSDAYSH